jgi:hypothetical protein
MAGVIVDAGKALDHRRDPGQRPQIGAEGVSRRPPTQGGVDLRELPRTQPWPTPQPPGGLQPSSALLAPRLIPAVGCLSTHAQRTDDCRLRLSVRQQPRGFEAPRFQRRNIPLLTRWLAHASASHRSS